MAARMIWIVEYTSKGTRHNAEFEYNDSHFNNDVCRAYEDYVRSLGDYDIRATRAYIHKIIEE